MTAIICKEPTHQDLLCAVYRSYCNYSMQNINKYEIWGLTAVTVLMVVFWAVTPCGLTYGYQCYGGTYCLHLHGWRWRPYVALKRWYPTVSLHSITTQKPTTDIGKYFTIFLLLLLSWIRPSGMLQFRIDTQTMNLRYTVGHIACGISTLQGLTQKTQKSITRWDSNLWSQCVGGQRL
jgi:hypothetical protein